MMEVNGTEDPTDNDDTAFDSVVDGLLSHDKEDVVERVAYLEKKVQQQEDEIVCLKSAIADVIRRLGSIEAGSQNSTYPSRNHTRTSQNRPRSMSGMPGSINKNNQSAMEHVNVVPTRTAPPSARGPPKTSRLSSAHSLTKWSSLATSAEMSNSALTPTFRSTSQGNLTFPSPRGVALRTKEPVWNQEEGTLKLCIRGRVLNLVAPSDLVDYSVSKFGEPPSEKLQLEWVYGYRGRDCRSNLYYLPTGEVIYFTAAVVILHNVEEQTQRHYMGHTDDIKCIAIHPDRIKVATGQVAGHEAKEGKHQQKKKPGTPDSVTDVTSPHVRVWDSVSLNTIHVIGLGIFNRGVACVSFSKLDGGQHLVVIDEANEHIISVWDISRDKPHKMTETKSSTEPVLAVEYHPLDKSSIVSCGKNQITFWTFEGGSIAKKQGIFDKYDKPKFVLCLAFTDNGDVLSGDSNGNILVWGKGSNRIVNALLSAHDGGVFSLCTLKDGTVLSGGGKDRKIIQWDSTYKKTGHESEVPETYGAVRTLSQGKGGLILVGTTRNCILYGSLDLELSVFVQGHTDELWGLATHPAQHQFLTCGLDKQLYLWDSQSRMVVWNKEMNDAIHSCCFHPRTGIIAVGTCVARWLVLDLTTHEIVSVHTDGNEQIECIQYSPDGSMLAVGSRDNFIYIYSVSDDGKKYSKIGRCSGHSSFITHIDWSSDGQYLASNSGDYELLYWTAHNCKMLTNMTVIKEISWATQYCVLAFNTAGIWQDGLDGTDINGSCKSHNERLVATCDDFGKVNLFSFPACQPKSSYHSYKGHSSHVTSVNFLFDDSRLISTGGKDTAVMQWQVVQ